MGHHVPGVPCHWGTLSLGHPVPGAPYPWGTLSVEHPVPGVPCPWGTLSLGHHVPGAPCHSRSVQVSLSPEEGCPSGTRNCCHKVIKFLQGFRNLEGKSRDPP